MIKSFYFQNNSEPIHITLLSRGTKFRKILNEDEVTLISFLFLLHFWTFNIFNLIKKKFEMNFLGEEMR